MIDASKSKLRISRRCLLAGAALGLAAGCDPPVKGRLHCLFEEEPEAGEKRPNRLIYLLVDRTKSVQAVSAQVQASLRRRVLDLTAPGDLLSGFLVNPTIDPYTEKYVLFEPPANPPLLRENIGNGRIGAAELGSRCSAATRLRRELADAWSEFEPIRSEAWKMLSDSASPKGPASNYLSSFEYVGKRFGEAASAAERYLVVVGDLREEGLERFAADRELPRIKADATRLRDERGELFRGIKVRLIRSSDADSALLESAWRDYFATLGAQDIVFSSMSDAQVGGLPALTVPRTKNSEFQEPRHLARMPPLDDAALRGPQ